MRLGKLSNKELSENVLSLLKRRRPEVKEASGIGQDCASFEIGGTLLISSDPITGSNGDIGSLAITINANDIISAGGECVLCTLTVLAPSNASVQDIKKIVEGAEREAERYGLEIVGGHTEFTDAVTKPIVSVTMVGRATKHIKATGAKSGDAIVMTKYAALEGTAILAADDAKVIAVLTEEEKAFAKTLFDSIDVSVEGKLARDEDGVHAMHDITEGGIFGAVCEMAEGSGLGAEIYVNKIPFLPLTEKVCSVLRIEPYRLISSGSLLISTDRPNELSEKLKKSGVMVSVIGRFTESRQTIAYYDGYEERIEVEADSLFTRGKR